MNFVTRNVLTKKNGENNVQDVVKRNCLVSTTKRKLVNTGEIRGVRCVNV